MNITKGDAEGKTQAKDAPQHPPIIGFDAVAQGIQGVEMMIEKTRVVVEKQTTPYVRTSAGSEVSCLALAGTRVGDEEVEESLRAMSEMNDDVVAALVLCVSRWTMAADRGNPRSFVEIPINDYCKMRGWKKHHNGGYQQAQKEKARKIFYSINKIFVRHKVPDHLRKKLPQSSGRPIMSAAYIEGQFMLVSVGSMDAKGEKIVSFRASPGTWADDLLRDNSGHVALLMERALQLDTGERAGKYAQRLGLYLSLNWQTKGTNGNIHQAHKVATLLDRIGIGAGEMTHREERRRCRASLQDALDMLQCERCIGVCGDDGQLQDRWDYAGVNAGRRDEHMEWDDWLKATVKIPMPTEIESYYKMRQEAHQARIAENAQAAKKSDQATEAAIKRHQKGEKITSVDRLTPLQPVTVPPTACDAFARKIESCCILLYLAYTLHSG